MEFNEDNIAELFGHEAAEDENKERLEEYYVKSDIYDTMRSKKSLLILVGHKGVGKSALLQMLTIEDKKNKDLSLNISPNEILSLGTVDNSFLEKINQWKEGLSKVLLTAILRETTDKSTENFEGEFIKKISDVAKNVLGKKIVDLNENYGSYTSAEFTKFISELCKKDDKIMIYLDDLDRGWKNSSDDIDNLSAMFNAIRDLTRELPMLKFRISLRSDIYYALRTADETTDKIDGSVVWQSWTNHQILVMLVKRIETFFGRSVSESELMKMKQSDLQDYMNPVFESTFKGKGHWSNSPTYKVLMSLIRKRPRDLIKLCTLAARSSYKENHDKIRTYDLESSFKSYSNGRLVDTATEYQAEFEEVKDLLFKMKPSQKELKKDNASLFSRSELIEKIKNVISMSSFRFLNGDAVTPEAVAAFLYKINFITARKKLSDGNIHRVYYDENQYIYNDFTDFGYSYEVHPAYRWALQPSDVEDLFNQIVLSNDDDNE